MLLSSAPLAHVRCLSSFVLAVPERFTFGIFRYLSGTTTLELKLKPDDGSGLIGYADADFGNCVDTRRSISGLAAYWDGMLFSWSSKMQPIVTTSTTEAEYVAAASGVKELLWIRNVLMELGVDIPIMTLMEDNQGAIANIKGDIATKRSKHVDIKYHFMKEVEIAVENAVEIAAEIGVAIDQRPSAYQG